MGLDPLEVRNQVLEQLRAQTKYHLIRNTSDENWMVRSEATQALVAVSDPGDETVMDVLCLKGTSVSLSLSLSHTNALRDRYVDPFLSS
jgi:hypothetical protein